MIDTPEHYSRWEIEPIDFIMANSLPFWHGNVIKYTMRAGYKTYDGLSNRESELLDLEKAKKYLDFRIQEILSE